MVANTGTAHHSGQAVILVGHRGPRIEEEQLHVEHQKEDGDQVKFDVEALAGVADGVHARFVRHLLDDRAALGPDGVGHDQHGGDHAEDEGKVDENRQVSGKLEGVHRGQYRRPEEGGKRK